MTSTGRREDGTLRCFRLIPRMGRVRHGRQGKCRRENGNGKHHMHSRKRNEKALKETQTVRARWL